MAWVNIVLFFLYYNLYNGLCCGHYVTFMQWNLLFALKLFLHSPNRVLYITWISHWKYQVQVMGWNIFNPFKCNKKKEKRKESKNATRSNCKGFWNERGAQKHGYFKNFLILKIHCSNVQLDLFLKNWKTQKCQLDIHTSINFLN